MSLSALVTTYNEADTIGPLVGHLWRYCSRVLVVDDRRSTDATERNASAAGAETIVDIETTGIGPCLLVGLRRLAVSEGRVVVIDAGGSHDPNEIPEMVRYRSDVVIGSRFLPASGYEGLARRKALSKAYAKACNLTTGQDIADWTSGFRIYSPAAVDAILDDPPTSKMHGFQPEALATCLRAGLRVAEHPITYTAGRTSMDHRVATEAVMALGRLSCL